VGVFSLLSSKKILYKIVFIIVGIFWGIVAILMIESCVARYYIYPLKNRQTVCEYSDVYGLDRSLIFAMIKVESSFDKDAESSAGAIGYMQITPDTAKYISDMLGIVKYDLKDVETNVNFGCFYVKYLLAKFKSKETAIVAYNAGEGNVILWLKDKECSDDGINLKKIPFTESKNYLEKVKKVENRYKKLYGKNL
jgi:soluble lytic murein transglycosylase